MLKNILFDLDGTLTDPKVGITRCIQFALENAEDHYNINVPNADDLIWCIGPPLKDSFSLLLNTNEDVIIEQALASYRERFVKKGMFENFIYPNVADSLGKLRKFGFKIFLATSKPGVFAVKILEHFKLAGFFHGIYGSELDGRFSDKGELVAHIIESEELNPKATMIVGDRMYDIIGGKKNGILTAGVTYGYGSNDEIASSKPDYVFDEILDLLSFLGA